MTHTTRLVNPFVDCLSFLPVRFIYPCKNQHYTCVCIVESKIWPGKRSFEILHTIFNVRNIWTPACAWSIMIQTLIHQDFFTYDFRRLSLNFLHE